MNQLLVPDQSISAIRSSAAAECRTGSDTRFMTDPKMTASRSVQLPAWHSGSSSPYGKQTMYHEELRPTHGVSDSTIGVWFIDQARTLT